MGDTNSRSNRWDIVGQQIVSELAGAATTALKAMMPALVMSVNPVAGGLSQLGSLTGKGGSSAGNSDNTSGNTSNTQKGAVQDSALRPTVDQAAVALQKDMTYIELLSAIVNGPSGNIDWEKANAKDAANVKSSIGFIANMLADAKSRFARLDSSTETSQKVKTILDTTAQVSYAWIIFDTLLTLLGFGRNRAGREGQQDGFFIMASGNGSQSQGMDSILPAIL